MNDFTVSSPLLRTSASIAGNGWLTVVRGMVCIKHFRDNLDINGYSMDRQPKENAHLDACFINEIYLRASDYCKLHVKLCLLNDMKT